MRYNQPSKYEETYISDKIKIIKNLEYCKIVAQENIIINDILIIEYSEYNLYGIEAINREKQMLKIYLDNKDDQFIKDLYPRTSMYKKTKLIKSVHKLIKNDDKFNIYDKDLIELIYAKYIYNAFEGYDFGPLTLPIISKINHSCQPNAKFKFNRKTGAMHLYATRDIKKNEELFISYLENKKIKSHKEYLQEHYGFDCNC
jgi:hypothetical protein